MDDSDCSGFYCDGGVGMIQVIFILECIAMLVLCVTTEPSDATFVGAICFLILDLIWISYHIKMRWN